MAYFGHGYGNDTPLWQYDFLEELAFSYSIFEFCVPSVGAAADPTAESDTASSSEAVDPESNTTQ